MHCIAIRMLMLSSNFLLVHTLSTYRVIY